MPALTYSFTRREKVLIATFVVLLLGLLWYRLVYVVTTDQMAELNGRIQTVQTNIEIDNTKLADQKRMERIIEERKAAGVKAKPIPNYDNLKPLMTELDTIMAKTDSYAMSFDALDMESSQYILRGIGIQFNSLGYDETIDIITHIADGQYPCVIDSVSISEHILSNTGTVATENKNSLTTSYSSTVHVVFFEKHPDTHVTATTS